MVQDSQFGGSERLKANHGVSAAEIQAACQESNSSDDPNHFKIHRPPAVEILFDEIHKNAGRMERSGNFFLSCDIKEA